MLPACVAGLQAQENIDVILNTIEQNNPYLSALRKQAEAESIGNMTGIYLQNPELEIGYLWNSPMMGNRTDIDFTQSFDFPTAYVYRKDMANAKNEKLGLEYLKQRQGLLLDARLLLIDLVYQNVLLKEHTLRFANAKGIAQAYEEKFKVGEVNIIDYNKAILNLIKAKSDLEAVRIEHNSVRVQLSALNGGNPVSVRDSLFMPMPMIVDFDLWFADRVQNSPELAWFRKQQEISTLQESLTRSLSYPKIMAGYKGELSQAENFQGITLGLSIPLWENKNAVKYAKIQTEAVKSLESYTTQSLYNQLFEKHTSAMALQKSLNEYAAQFVKVDSRELLALALEKGEINLIDYLMELSIYNESRLHFLQMEYELHRALAYLEQY